MTDYKLQSEKLNPTEKCIVYISCDNARKLKNKLDEYKNNKIWFNIKKLLRLKRYLTILNNYLFILYYKMYKENRVLDAKIKRIESQHVTQNDTKQLELENLKKFTEEKYNNLKKESKIDLSNRLNEIKENVTKKIFPNKSNYNNLTDDENNKIADELINNFEYMEKTDIFKRKTNFYQCGEYTAWKKKFVELNQLKTQLLKKDKTTFFNDLKKSIQSEKSDIIKNKPNSDIEKPDIKNYYTEFGGVFKTLLFSNVYDFITFWASNADKLREIISSIDELKELNELNELDKLGLKSSTLKDILDNYIIKKDQQDILNKIYQGGNDIDNQSNLNMLIEELDKVENHIKNIADYIRKINAIIHTEEDDIKKKILDNNNPIFDDLNDYVNYGDIIEVNIRNKGLLRRNYKGCITQINVDENTFVVTYYSIFTKKLYIEEYSLNDQLCIKNQKEFDHCKNNFLDKTPIQFTIVKDFQKFIFDTGSHSNNDNDKHCKIMIDINNANKLIVEMKKMTKMTKNSIPNHYMVQYNNIVISIKNNSLFNKKNTIGYITDFNPIKHNFTITYYTKFIPIARNKKFNFNKLCISDEIKNLNNTDAKNTDANNLTQFDKIRENVLNNYKEKTEIIERIITNKSDRSRFIRRIFNLIKKGLIILAVAAVIAAITAIILYIIANPIAMLIGFAKFMAAIIPLGAYGFSFSSKKNK